MMKTTCLARLAMGAAVLLSIAAPRPAQAQWSRTYEQFYLPGTFNFTFRREYPAADRLFNAFDYGHAILYERLLNEPAAATRALEVDEYDFITKTLLVSPPRLPLEEAAIEVNYARLAPEAKQMFDWAHLLHRQIYDVLASERMSQDWKDAKVAELVAYYKTRQDLAFSSVPKNMELMEGQPYSLAFRQRYPKFNGLIWGYHWLQVGLYEPLMTGRTQEERQSGVLAATTRFKQMLENAPERMPRVMPMTAAIAPQFAARYEEAAIIFDNLHAMHDVVSDILANNAMVPRAGKRAAILQAASRYRDDTSFVMPMAEWRGMGQMMGIVNMGGPAVGITTEWGTPTIARGATMVDAMKGMNHGAGAGGAMPGMNHGAGAGGAMPGMNHGATPMPGMGGMRHGPDSAAKPAAVNPHAGHDMSSMAGVRPDSGGSGMSASEMKALHDRMMNDPVIHARMMADTAMHRMMQRMMPGMSHDMPMAGGEMKPGMTHDMSGHAMSAPAARSATPARRPATRKAASKRAPAKRAVVKRTAPAPKPKPMPPMDHSKMPMPGMKP